MLLQHNKVDLENNQEMEQENAVKLPWINLSLAPCCADMPAMALLLCAACQAALGAGSRQCLTQMAAVLSSHCPSPLEQLGELVHVLGGATPAVSTATSEHQAGSSVTQTHGQLCNIKTIFFSKVELLILM